MKILIIGAGGREHALAASYVKSTRVSRVFVAPGNDFMEETDSKIRAVPKVTQLDISAIIAFVKKEKIDLVDVAQDEPLSAGVVDALVEKGVRVFGPTKSASEIEWNKAWSRDFMKKYGLPIPSFSEFSSEEKAREFVKKKPEQVLYIKASGLASGKGAIRAENQAEAYAAISSMKNFGKSGATFLIEEAIVGEEFSLFAICDGSNYLILGYAQDHKTLYNNDRGLNTGGMGAVAPAGVIKSNHLKEIENKILKPFLEGMRKEGRVYKGILFLGGMLTKKGIEIIEFNSRWGDPEAQVVLSGLKTDYLTLVEAAIEGSIHKKKINFDNKIRISVACCVEGYPDDWSGAKGKVIYGLGGVMKIPGVLIFGAGIKRSGKEYTVNGGRVVHLVAEGKDIYEARCKAYQAISQLYIEGNRLFYRTDIGWREIERKLGL